MSQVAMESAANIKNKKEGVASWRVVYPISAVRNRRQAVNATKFLFIERLVKFVHHAQEGKQGER